MSAFQNRVRAPAILRHGGVSVMQVGSEISGWPRQYRVLLFILLAAVGLQAQTGPNPSSASGVGNSLRSIVQSGRLDELRWPNFSDFRSQVDTFYRSSSYSMAWIQNGKPSARAREMIDILQHADAEGLRPEDYDAPRWPDRLAHLDGSYSSADASRFDAALTICAMRYASAIRVGRINPKHFQF